VELVAGVLLSTVASVEALAPGPLDLSRRSDAKSERVFFPFQTASSKLWSNPLIYCGFEVLQVVDPLDFLSQSCVLFSSKGPSCSFRRRSRASGRWLTAGPHHGDDLLGKPPCVLRRPRHASWQGLCLLRWSACGALSSA